MATAERDEQLTGYLLQLEPSRVRRQNNICSTSYHIRETEKTKQTKIKVTNVLFCSCDADLRVAIAGWISSSAKMLG